MVVHTANQSAFTRHVGTFNDKRIALVLQLPEQRDMVHVVDTDALPDAYHQGLMNIISSPEAQHSTWLGDILCRTMFFDGTNVLRTLYERNWIIQAPVGGVTLTPRPNMTVSLVEVLGAMGQDPLAKTQNPVGERESQLDEIARKEQAKLDQWHNDPAVTPLHNQHTENLKSDSTDKQKAMAVNLVAQAEALEVDAKRYRSQAAQLDPSLRTQTAPVITAATPKTDNTVAVDPSKPFIDGVTGKAYATVSALKGAVSKREKAQSDE